MPMCVCDMELIVNICFVVSYILRAACAQTLNEIQMTVSFTLQCKQKWMREEKKNTQNETPRQCSSIKSEWK